MQILAKESCANELLMKSKRPRSRKRNLTSENRKHSQILDAVTADLDANSPENSSRRMGGGTRRCITMQPGNAEECHRILLIFHVDEIVYSCRPGRMTKQRTFLKCFPHSVIISLIPGNPRRPISHIRYYIRVCYMRTRITMPVMTSFKDRILLDSIGSYWFSYKIWDPIKFHIISFKILLDPTRKTRSNLVRCFRILQEKSGQILYIFYKIL
jgi:hypothetical protein